MTGHWRALASDYDRTLAIDGRVSHDALVALQELKADGYRFLLVTGRRLPDLARVFPQVDLADYIVAENGAVLYTTATRELRLLAAAPHLDLVDLLTERGVPDLEVGEVILAMPREHETTARECLRQLGLARSVIPNRDRVMLLPLGVDKAFGLGAALRELGLRPDEVVGIGDGENDVTLIDFCGLGVAVADAEPVVLATADLICAEGASSAVIETIARLRNGTLGAGKDRDRHAR